MPLCLPKLNDCVDEIVIVDGSPSGPSTDKTLEICKKFSKVKYLTGAFRTIPGSWDTGSQKNLGITESSGDVFMFLSADMIFYNLERLCQSIREDDFKIFFCPTIEFWLDTQHIRMYAPLGNLSLPSGAQEAVAISRDSQPVVNEHGSLEIIAPKPNDQVLINDTFKFHLGWIRPFGEQVAKHIRHIRQNRWGEEGAKLLSGSEQKLEQWAILHVLSYKQVASVSLKCVFPEELNGYENMNYLQGQEAVIQDYQKKYGASPFRGSK
jgi:glycosyltransferase involved in cell wall biosynthesis